MTHSASGAEHLVQQLEVLLHTARAAAAGLGAGTLARSAPGTSTASGNPSDATSLGVGSTAAEWPHSEATPGTDNGASENTCEAPQQATDHGADHRTERLSLFSLAAHCRNGVQRYVVQLQAGAALYEGMATALDFAESRLHVAARATLAALAEWSGSPMAFGLGDVQQVSLNCGPAVIVTVAVRLTRPGPDVRALAEFFSTRPSAAPSAQIDSADGVGVMALTDGNGGGAAVAGAAADTAGVSRSRDSSTRWFVGSALQWDDPAAATVRAVLEAVRSCEG